MNELIIKRNNQELKIYVNKLKILLSSNPVSLYQYLEILFNQTRNFKLSDLDNDEGHEYSVTLNENRLTSSNCEVFRFDPWWNLEDESKMTSGTLMKKYVTLAIQEMMFMTEIQNINQELEIFIDDYINDESNFSDFRADLLMNSLNASTLLKLLSIDYNFDGLSYKTHNTNYEERLEIFLTLLTRICGKDLSKTYIAIIDVPLIGNNLMSLVSKVECDNLLLLVNTSKIVSVPRMEWVYVDSGNNVDLLNEDSLVNLINVYGIGYDFESVERELEDQFETIEKFNDFIDKIL